MQHALEEATVRAAEDKTFLKAPPRGGHQRLIRQKQTALREKLARSRAIQERRVRQQDRAREAAYSLAAEEPSSPSKNVGATATAVNMAVELSQTGSEAEIRESLMVLDPQLSAGRLERLVGMGRKLWIQRQGGTTSPIDERALSPTPRLAVAAQGEGRIHVFGTKWTDTIKAQCFRAVVSCGSLSPKDQNQKVRYRSNPTILVQYELK